MLVNEKDAKTKWCPLSNAPRSLMQSEFATCIGTACMFWRWNPGEMFNQLCHVAGDGEIVDEPPRPDNVPKEWVWSPYNKDLDGEPSMWVEPQEMADARRLGFCGAAVRPHED